ncbi:type II toxin-antitoxin system VapC family toxin [Candidatus Binatus sp.]|uniref:type II toxin-antitoxin system VapC family toxin n=1 Tax=Candidatus Binatus sp. TaxID=2811406 RepID=UPI003CC06100
MRFWDSSALVPIFIKEPATAEVEEWRVADPGITTWMMTRVEVLAAIARRKRERPEMVALWNRAVSDVNEVALRWIEIYDAAAARVHAERIVMDHPLRTADALQLGAALVAADGDPQSLELVTLDRRLAEAARREGFPVLGVR